MDNKQKDILTLVITVLFGWAGVHRFMAGKIGSGLLYLFTVGLFTIGWIIDIVLALQAMTGATPAKAKNTTMTTTKKPPANNSEVFEFSQKDKAPEVDEHGRIVVRLTAGSKIEIPLHFIDNIDEDAARKYIQGNKKGKSGDDGTLSVRLRLIPRKTEYWGGTCYRFETPSGIPLLEARSYFEDRFEIIETIIKSVTENLAGQHESLVHGNFVFDVPIRFDYVWDDLNEGSEKETSEVIMEFDSPVLSLKEPLEIDIK